MSFQDLMEKGERPGWMSAEFSECGLLEIMFGRQSKIEKLLY